MYIGREEQQREEFISILYELAKDQNVLDTNTKRSNMYKRLESLYHSTKKEEEFRHFYSDIFSVLTDINNSQSSKVGDINILGQNLEIIRKGYEVKNKDENGDFINIKDNIRKLYDHVNLDIARIIYSEAGNRKVTGEETIYKLQADIKNVEADIEKTKEENKLISEELLGQQKEYIAILGIFAAVVLAFTGGIAFSTSVLNNIAQASVYRTALISLIVGLVLVNVLFGLFYYIDNLVNKTAKLKPLIISNVVMIALIMVISIAWKAGLVEKRNNEIAAITQQIQNVEPSGAIEDDMLLNIKK